MVPLQGWPHWRPWQGLHAACRAWLAALALALMSVPSPAQATEPVAVGSKRFTESYILGELVTQVLQAAGTPAQHRAGLGNTAIVEQALASGAIQVYPEYTGTIVRELLKREGNPSLDELNQWLAPRGLKAAVPLGFNNTYALAMRAEQARALGVRTVSDLARLPAAQRLRLGLSHEFMARADGWPALQAAYALPQQPGAGLDHGLAYEALAGGQVDLIDVYSTDAKIGRLKLTVLEDDRGFFPRYDAVLLMRSTLDAQPLAAALQGRIDAATMVALNAEVELDGKSFAEVARGWLARQAAGAGGGNAAALGPAAAGSAAAAAVAGGAGSSAVPGTAAATPTVASPPRDFIARLLAPDLPRLLGQHLALVGASLLLAVAVGVPLGLLAHRRPRLAAWVLGLAGVLQTVPSLALLAFLIAALGVIGFLPALLALALYALLPVLRNTVVGLQGVPAGLVQAASALGLRRGQVLQAVELPLALPVLLAGIKTAAVINVGTATVAAFVGAGGLGERIVAGLAVNDTTQMLAGAVPAALLALGVQAGFAGLERVLAPRGGGAARG